MTSGHGKFAVREDSPDQQLARAERLKAKNDWIWSEAWKLDPLSWSHGNPPADWCPDPKLLRKLAKQYKGKQDSFRREKQSIVDSYGMASWCGEQIERNQSELDDLPHHPVHYERIKQLKQEIATLKEQAKTEG